LSYSDEYAVSIWKVVYPQRLIIIFIPLAACDIAKKANASHKLSPETKSKGTTTTTRWAKKKQYSKWGIFRYKFKFRFRYAKLLGGEQGRRWDERRRWWHRKNLFS